MYLRQASRLAPVCCARSLLKRAMHGGRHRPQGNCVLATHAAARRVLRVIDVGHNHLQRLPPALCQCTALQEIRADNNGIRELQGELHQLVNLKVWAEQLHGFLGDAMPGCHCACGTPVAGMWQHARSAQHISHNIRGAQQGLVQESLPAPRGLHG